MRNSRIVALALAVAAVWVLQGAAFGEDPVPVAVSRNGAKPVDPKSGAVLVLPCDASGFWGTGVDAAACSRVLSEKAPAAWGAGAVSPEPLAAALEKEGLGNLAWRLAIGAWHVWEDHKSFDPGADPCKRGIEALPRDLERAAALAVDKAGLKTAPRFVLALHVGCRGAGEKPDTLKLRVVAVLWEMQAGKVHTIVHRVEEARAADVIGRMSGIPAEAARLAGKAAPAGEADPSKPLKAPWKMQVHARKGAKPVDLAKEKILLLPCGAKMVAGEPEDLTTSAALFAGIVTSFGASGVGLEPLKPVFEAAGLDSLACRLCWGAYHVVDFHDAFDLNDGCGQGIEEVPAALSKAAGLAVEKFGIGAPFPKFLFGLAVVSLGEPKPGVLKYRVIACLYDLEGKQVHAVAWSDRSTPKEAWLAEMAVLPGEVFERMGKVAFKK